MRPEDRSALMRLTTQLRARFIIVILSPAPPPQASQQQIQNLANNDLLPISEIAKKASEINGSEEVEIKLN
jgi:hypothetical protein